MNILYVVFGSMVAGAILGGLLDLLMAIAQVVAR